MHFKLFGTISVFFQICAVGKPVTKQNMHDGTRQSTVSPGADQDRNVRLRHGAVLVDINGDDLRAAFFARARGMGHHVDLRVDRVAAPYDDEIGLGHLTRVRPHELACASDKACLCQWGADGVVDTAIIFCMAQTVDTVTHDQPHGAGKIIWPDSLAAISLFCVQEFLGSNVEGVIPAYAFKFLRALFALAA